MGYKGAWSGIMGFGALFTFWLVSFMGAPGIYLGILVIALLLFISDDIYKETTPEQIKKNRTYKEKYEMTKFCKTADEVHDVLFYDLVTRAAKGYARKKRLKYPDRSCYCLAIRAYTSSVIYSDHPGFPEFLKEKGCTMVYYKPIIREKYIAGIKCVYKLGWIYSLAVSDKGLHRLEIPNAINQISRMKDGWLDSWHKEVETTRISDDRWTIESERERG